MAIGMMRENREHIVELALLGLRVAAAGETLVESAGKL